VTAIAETRDHRARFLAMTREDPLEIDMRTYLADLDCELHDIRGPHFGYVWDGTQITTVYEKKLYANY